MMSEQLSDHLVREEVTDPRYSFVVDAPAGSGKTTLLVMRILKLLGIVEKPNEIVAITFTKKAAAEMRSRLINAMNDSRHRELVKKISRNASDHGWDVNIIESLDIMTIDSLASKIIRRAPILSNAFLANITEDPKDLYEQAVSATILGMANEQKELISFLNYDTQKIKSHLFNLLDKRDQWIDLIADYKVSDISTIEQKTYDYYQLELKPHIDKFSNAFSVDELREIESILIYTQTVSLKKPFLYKPNNIKFWLELGRLALTTTGSVRTIFGSKLGFSGDEESNIHSAKLKKIIKNKYNTFKDLNSISNVIDVEKIADIFPAMAPKIASLLYSLDTNLSKLFLITKTMDFTQALRYANATLDQTSVAELLDNQVSHILIDEYQDTNESQVKFIKKLTDNFSGNPKKSFFAVGDPMQSIYRFRKAEVRLFKDLQNNGIGDLKPISRKLKVNFRSSKKICDWLNSEYRKAFGAEDCNDKGLIQYNACESDPNKLESGDGIRFHLLNDDGKRSFTSKHNEAAYVYDLIINICKEKSNEKDSEYSIAVIAPYRSHLREILTLFKRKGIPEGFKLVTTEIDELQDKQSFQDIFSLTKALYNLSDKISWVATLRAPWCGLTLADLCTLFEDNQQMTAWEAINDPKIFCNLSKDGALRLGFLRGVINNHIDIRGRVSHRFFIESIWRQLRGDVLLLDPDDIDYIDIFLDSIDKSSTPLSIDFEQLTRLVERLHTSSQSIEKVNKEIKFMTIHKAKGLEFNTVIIPGLSQQLNVNEHSIVAVDNGILSLNNYNPDEDNLYDYQRSKETLRLKNEWVRLLYVGISRAKEDCHLIGTIKPTKNGEFNAHSNSLLNILGPIIKDSNQWNFIDIQKKMTKGLSNYESYEPKLRRIKSNHFTTLHVKKTDASVKINDQVLKITNEDVYTFTGNIIHNYFKLIIKKQLDIEYILSNKLDYIIDLFEKKGYKNEQNVMAVSIIKKSLSALCNSKDGQWIYQVHEDDQFELKHIVMLGDDFEIRIPDRTFIHNNTRWIIDYKVLFGDKDLSIEAKKHLRQLNIYESLFDDKYPVIKAIYFAPQGKLIRL